MKISEIMRSNFLHFDTDTTLAAAAKKLAEKGQRDAPVIRKGKFVGMFSVSDLASALVKQSMLGKVTAADTKKAREEVVLKHMAKKTAHLEPDSDILSAFILLLHRAGDTLPVVDRKGTVVGVVMLDDLRKQMAKMLLEGGNVPRLEKIHEKEEDLPDGKNTIDRLLYYVQKKGSVSSEEIALKLNIKNDEVEDYAVSLEKNGLIKIDYSILGKMKLVKRE